VLHQTALAVLGAGSWGTALAIQFARTGRAVRLWGRDPQLQAEMQLARCNNRYLPGCPFPDTLTVVADFATTLQGCSDVLLAVPSHAFRELLRSAAALLTPGTRVAWATKGFERDSGKLPHQIARELLKESHSIAVLSGPTFAREVGAGLPTAITIASPDHSFAVALTQSISNASFRAYTASDIIGVEVGGAVKNVLAVGAGLSDGLGFGANTRVALITRGLSEMTRLGLALGAQRDTFMGLAGLGDLVLTCTDDQSRNRRFGLLLAQNCSATVALSKIGQVVEGYVAAQAVQQVAACNEVDMPICQGIYGVLYQGKAAADVVHGLMTRPIKAETA
jgi:glycerol-3-phosphate dehydrogenase (NAD(P)+)